MSWEDNHRAWRRSAPSAWEAVPASARRGALERPPSGERPLTERQGRHSVPATQVPVQVEVISPTLLDGSGSSTSDLAEEEALNLFVAPLLHRALIACERALRDDFDHGWAPDGGEAYNVALGAVNRLRNQAASAAAAYAAAAYQGGPSSGWLPEGFVVSTTATPRAAVPSRPVRCNRARTLSPSGRPGEYGPGTGVRRPSLGGLPAAHHTLGAVAQHSSYAGVPLGPAPGCGTPSQRSPRHSRQGPQAGRVFRRSASSVGAGLRGPSPVVQCASLQPVPLSVPGIGVNRFKSCDGPPAMVHRPDPTGPPPRRAPPQVQVGLSRHLPPEGPILSLNNPPPEAQIVTTSEARQPPDAHVLSVAEASGTWRMPRGMPASWEAPVAPGRPQQGDGEVPSSARQGNGVRRRTTPADGNIDREQGPASVASGLAPLPSPLLRSSETRGGADPSPRTATPASVTTPLPPKRQVRNKPGLPRHSSAATATFMIAVASADPVTFTMDCATAGSNESAAPAAAPAADREQSCGEGAVPEAWRQKENLIDKVLARMSREQDAASGAAWHQRDRTSARSARSTGSASGSLGGRSNPQEAGAGAGPGAGGHGSWALQTVDEDLATKMCECEDLRQLGRLAQDLPQEITAGPKGPKPRLLGTWMIWMVHRVYLNDPELKELDFSTYGLPAWDEESRIVPKLWGALVHNEHLRNLLLADCNLLVPYVHRPTTRDEQVESMANALAVSRSLRVLDVACNFFGPVDLQVLFGALAKNSSLEELRCSNQFCEQAGREALQALDRALKQNQTLRKLGMELTDAHWRDQINRGLLRNQEAARKRRWKQIQAGPELAEMAAFVSRLMGADAGGA
mmetsp:Transcript_42727/g.110477  ORF Transcript_42727/g.110477 Transcript_42727/m.110477 type:complete len:854 (+) Transcript_42727:61-2622(+)